jgi:hypothetical protein
MGIFAKLEGTGLALWVGESLWGYPIMLSLHVIGLAIVVGIFSMRDLRLLGLFEGVSYEAFDRLGRLAWAGFVVNAISGFVLFSSQATTFVQSTPFLLKIASIFAAAVCAAIIQTRSRTEAPAWDTGGILPSASTRSIAAVSLCLWIGAIVAGRLIAYL